MVYRLKVESDIVEKLGLGNNDELVLISVKTQLAAGINYFFKVTLIF